MFVLSITNATTIDWFTWSKALEIIGAVLMGAAIFGTERLKKVEKKIRDYLKKIYQDNVNGLYKKSKEFVQNKKNKIWNTSTKIGAVAIGPVAIILFLLWRYIDTKTEAEALKKLSSEQSYYIDFFNIKILWHPTWNYMIIALAPQLIIVIIFIIVKIFTKKNTNKKNKNEKEINELEELAIIENQKKEEQTNPLTLFIVIILFLFVVLGTSIAFICATTSLLLLMILLFPYWILDKITEKKNLESTILLIGFITGLIGIIIS